MKKIDKRHKIKTKYASSWIMISVIIMVTLSACTQRTTSYQKTGFYFNTIITLTLYDEKEASLLEDSFALCDKYEKLLSKTVEGSDIWNINHSNGKPTKVSSETIKLIDTADYFSKLTNGLIDISVTPVSELWNFTSTKEHIIPSQQQIDRALSLVNYNQIHINYETSEVTLDNPNAQIDLGFIAKGFIADELKAFLTENEVSNGLINLGGNVLAIGTKPDNSAYTIGIQKPFGEQNDPIETISIRDRSVVSSGTYERYFEKNGKIYHHILDPKTGYPVDNDLNEVTILSDSSMIGDALSTTCFALGLEEGMQLINELDNIEAVFITKDDTLHYSNGFSNK